MRKIRVNQEGTIVHDSEGRLDKRCPNCNHPVSMHGGCGCIYNVGSNVPCGCSSIEEEE